MWSFVRDDQPRSETCKQLALAIRDEVSDLEAAGVEIIQVDEPAIREGLPLRRDRWDEYLDWAVLTFRLSTSSVRDETQIQTHMCYSEFGDIMRQIQEMDADVLLIEAARSKMELLEDWKRTGYENEIGPGPLRHPLSAHPVHRGDGGPAAPGRAGARARAAVGRPRLRPEDPPLRGGRAVAARTWSPPRSSCAKS